MKLRTKHKLQRIVSGSREFFIVMGIVVAIAVVVGLSVPQVFARCMCAPRCFVDAVTYCKEDVYRNVICKTESGREIFVQRHEVLYDVVDIRERVNALGRIELVTILDEMGYWAYEDQPLYELREELFALIEETGQTWRLFMSPSRKESD